MNQEIINENLQSLKKIQAAMERERQSAANNAARLIVKKVEEETGKELSLNLCVKIVEIVSAAQ